MKVIHLNHSDATGGAARAAYRIHKALRDYGIDSRMWVNSKSTSDWTVTGPRSKWELGLNLIRPSAGRLANKLFSTPQSVLHSPALIPSQWPKRINNSDADLIHLHWINGEMLSIEDIAKIKKPIVWTFHDMWPLCGTEHLSNTTRSLDGYLSTNRPTEETGVDLSRWTWRRKQRNWKKPFHIVCPSTWLHNKAKASALFSDFPTTIIPNPIDTKYWKPLSREYSREALGLPKAGILLTFGAFGGTKDKNKGFDLLVEALRHLKADLDESINVQLLIFGEYKPQHARDLGFTAHYFEHLHDEVSMKLLLNASDATLIPSRIENFPNIAVESLACGTPVVAFNQGGIRDLLIHNENGYCAEAHDPADFANGINWIIKQEWSESRRADTHLKLAALCNQDRVAEQYTNLYLNSKE